MRLPTGVNGQITLCPAINAQAPALAKQLADLQKSVSGQQAEMAELLRLVRTVNNVSQNLGTARQTELLQNIYARLNAATNAGPQRVDARLADLNTGFDGVQGQMMSVLSNPATSTKAKAAVQGPVGDAIARLDFTTAADQLADIQAQLKAISANVSEVNDRTKAIANSVEDVRTEQARQAAASAQQQADLKRSIDPLSFASPQQTALIKESNVLLADLSEFSSQWGRESVNESKQAANTFLEANKLYMEKVREPRTPVDTAAIKAQVNAKWDADFDSQLQPAISLLYARLVAVKPDLRLQNHHTVGNDCTEIEGIKNWAHAENPHHLATAPDPTLVDDAEALMKRCSVFSHARVKAINDDVQQAEFKDAPKQPELEHPHLADQQMAAQYKSELLGRLVTWRQKLYADWPDHPAPLDFQSVATRTDFMQVYGNVSTLLRAYQLDLTARLRTPAATK